MHTKNRTLSFPYGYVLWLMIVGGVATSFAAAWAVATFGPESCDRLTVRAAFERIPVVLNLFVFFAAFAVTNVCTARIDDPQVTFLDMTWFMCWVAFGLGCTAIVPLSLQLPEHLWASFNACGTELGYGPGHFQMIAVATHLIGWTVVLLAARLIPADRRTHT